VALVESRALDAQNREEWHLIDRWLKRLGLDLVDRRPPLLFTQLWSAYSRSQWAHVRVLAQRVKSCIDQVRAQASDPDVDLYLLELGVVQVIQKEIIDSAEQIAACRRALDGLPADRRYVRGLALAMQALAYQVSGRLDEGLAILYGALQAEGWQVDAYTVELAYAVAYLHGREGRIREADQAARTLLVMAERVKLTTAEGWAHTFLGMCCCREGRYEEAVFHLEQVVNDRYVYSARVQVIALHDLLYLYTRRGEVERGAAILSQQRALTYEMGDMGTVPWLHGLEIEVARYSRRTEGLRSCIERGMPLRRVDEVLFPDMVWIQGAIEIYGTDLSPAVEADLQQLVTTLEKVRHRWYLPVAYVLQALVDQLRERPRAAMSALRKAAEIVPPSQYPGFYQRWGAELEPLLVELRGEGIVSAAGSADGRAMARQVLLPPVDMVEGAEEVEDDFALGELLTRRESQILRLLATAMSEKEIASELVISVHTVRKHIASVYGKLKVHNRREALLKVRRSQLLQRVGGGLSIIPGSPEDSDPTQ
jgi:LuxR family transcriptional regulator, maltose regulon positive regulatory protein